MEALTVAAHLLCSSFGAILHHQNSPFICLLVFRYLRLLVHLVSYFMYRPSPIPETPTLTGRDCTIIIPTCAPEDLAFRSCVGSIVQTSPRVLHIVTVGQEQEKQAWSTIAPFVSGYPTIHFKISHSLVANKRQQVAVALKSVKTAITVLCDDHVIWPSSSFLRAAIAPFDEDIQVGGVGTKKCGIRFTNTGLWQGFWNVMGALYLCRHNFEHTSSNAIDGGVLVISGRTSLYRTHIIQDKDFLDGYLNERCFFGLVGPLAADDDNFLTRALVKKGYKIKFQNTADATILCEVGEYPKYLKQCLRWARTTFRSNTCSLITDRSVYRSPWSVYALQISQMINFALFYDASLVFTLTRTGFFSATAMRALCTWILVSKLPKLLPYFWRHPADLIYLPCYYVFAYYHSLIKLWALLTWFDIQWSGRNLASINDAAAQTDDDQITGGPPVLDDEYFKARSSRPSMRSVHTPWGFVFPQNHTTTPANIMQTQQAGNRWPKVWSRRPGLAYDDVVLDDYSPRAFEFEERLATPPSSLGAGTGYPTPMSTGSHWQRPSYMGSPTLPPPRPALITPPTSPGPVSTPRRAPATPSRSWVRVDACGRLHSGSDDAGLRLRQRRRYPFWNFRNCLMNDLMSVIMVPWRSVGRRASWPWRRSKAHSNAMINW